MIRFFSDLTEQLPHISIIHISHERHIDHLLICFCRYTHLLYRYLIQGCHIQIQMQITATCLTGTGYFDLYAYQQYNDGTMTDYIPTDGDLQAGFDALPKVEA